MYRNLLVCTLAATALFACNADGGDDSLNPAETPEQAAPVTASTEEALTAEVAGEIANANDALYYVELADAAYQNVPQTAAIMEFMGSQLEKADSCVSVQVVEGESVRVDFNGDVGCTGRYSGKTVYGSITIRYEEAEGFHTVGADLDGFGGEIRSDGSIEVTTDLAHQSSTSISVQLSDGRALDFSGQMRLAGNQLEFSGEATLVDLQGNTYELTYEDFVWVAGDCYPSSGTATITVNDEPPVSVTFTEETPETGVVEVKIGRGPALPKQLPTNHC